MRRAEIYLYISIALFVIDMFIIPVGGMCESNSYHNEYFYSFLICEINLFVSLAVMAVTHIKSMKDGGN